MSLGWVDQLAGQGHAAAAPAAHAGYYCTLAEGAASLLDGPDQPGALAQVAVEGDNLRAALSWALAQAAAGLALRLCLALLGFWQRTGTWSEGRYWLAAALAVPAPSDGRRAQALGGAGVRARTQGDLAQARRLLEASLAICRTIDAPHILAATLLGLGSVALVQGHYPQAVTADEEALAVLAGPEVTPTRGWVRASLAAALAGLGRTAEAEHLLAASLADFQALGAPAAVAYVLNLLGEVARIQQIYPRAAEYYTEALALFRTLDNAPYIATTLNNLGRTRQMQGDHAAAAPLFVEALAIGRRTGAPASLMSSWTGLAGVAAATGRPLVAARLFGAATAFAQTRNLAFDRPDQQHRDALLAAATPLLTPEAWAAAWAEGQALPIEQACDLAASVTALRADPAEAAKDRC